MVKDGVEISMDRGKVTLVIFDLKISHYLTSHNGRFLKSQCNLLAAV